MGVLRGPLLGGLISLLLFGCGGGGGGGGTASSLPTATLTQQNADVALGLSASMSDTIFTIVRDAQETARAAHLAGGTSGSIACLVSGSIEWSLTDRDGSSTMTSGDSLRREYRDCVANTFGPRNGEVIEMRLDTVPGVEDRLSGLISLVSGYTEAIPNVGQLTLSGALRFEHLINVRSQTLNVLPVGSQIALTGSVSGTPVNEQVLNLQMSRILDTRAGLLTQDIGFTYASSVVGGLIDVRTPTALESDLHSYPHAGRLVVTGAADTSIAAESAVVVESSREFFRSDIVTRAEGRAPVTRRVNWFDVVSDDFWWADGIVPRRPLETPIATERQFRVLLIGQSGPAQQPVQEWVFSRPIDTGRVGALRFTRTPAAVAGVGIPYTDTDWADEQLSAQITVDGSRLTISPTGLLQLGRDYPMEAVAGTGWIMSGTVPLWYDRSGRSTTISLAANPPNALRAIVDFDPPDTSSPPGTLHLSARLSDLGFGGTNPIVSYRWRQVSGPELRFAAPTDMQTTAAFVGSYPADDTSVVIDLEVTNTAGEVDHDRRTVFIPKRRVDTPTFFFRSGTGSFVGAGKARRQAVDLSASWQGSGNATSYVIRFDTDLPSPMFDPSVLFSFERYAGLSIVAPATYNTSNTPASPIGSSPLSVSIDTTSCSTPPEEWKVDVLEYAHDASNNIVTLAADFEFGGLGAPQGCGRMYGSVRINSAIPIRP
jgi:hypothetical protein